MTAERTSASSGEARRLGRVTPLALAPLGTTAASVAIVDGWDGEHGAGLAWLGLSLVWGVAGGLLLRHGDTRLGMLALWFSFLSGVASLDAPTLAAGLAVALLPVAAMHILLALPSGALATRAAVGVVGGSYLIGAAAGIVLWTQRPSAPRWPIVIEALVAAAVGVRGATGRYRRTQGTERARMHVVALAVAAATEIVLVATTLHVLVGWPPRLLQIAAAATVPIPLTLLLWRSKRLVRRAKRLVAPAISVAGVTVLVVAVYAVVVLGLGRPPTHDERTLLLLSVVAACISAVLYAPSRARLFDFSNRLVHGDGQSPEGLVRTFGARLSRAVPLDELFLHLAESLRRALALSAAEVWAGSGGALERVVSEPDRGPASLRLTTAEASVIARTRISGRARIAVWLPQLLADRGDALIRIAPMAHAGELFGLIVAERAVDGEPFDDDAERVLAELAGQVGLALRNVQLDSELQASLDELRRQAVELKASRARVVAAADAERRRIERDLHDGAQQYLVGIAANLGVVRALTNSDPEQAKSVVDELQDSIQAAMQAFRDLAHGIYPPLLEDRGLADALTNAARHASIPTRVETTAVRRYDPRVEATVYFCCLESLQNAAKHAGDAARATVRVWEEEGGLLFDVADDGAGLDPTRRSFGSGLTNMRDRLEAIGGSLRIESTAGHGTRVVGAIPLPR